MRCCCVFKVIIFEKYRAQAPATLLKRDSGTGVFL